MRIDVLIDYLRECDSLDSEEVHNLILDLEALQSYVRGQDVRLTDATRMEKYYKQDSEKQIKEKVKYKDALKEIKTFPARDISENWNTEQWARFYKQDIDKLQRIASSALYEVKI